MTFDSSWARSHSVLHAVSLFAAAGTLAIGCTPPAQHGGDTGLYSQGRIQVDDATRQRWDASEKEVRAAGERLHPIRDTDASTAIPVAELTPASLRALQASERHGAGEKRFLSVLDTSARRRVVRPSDITAQITLVKGSEYKSEKDFASGWLPLAIVVLPPRPEGDPVLYPKLKLHGDTSWVFVRERKDASWVGAVVRIADGRVEQDPLSVTASSDSLEPVIGARFAWEENDESIWGTCGGRCCKMVGK
jgi:hypothetical protein